MIPEIYKKGVKADVIVVDPSRKGCDEKLLDVIAQMGPERVIYLMQSDNPGKGLETSVGKRLQG